MDQFLSKFNFSAGEATVYKALLKLGGAKVSEVAKATGLKRTTCQEYIQSLAQKGFINGSKLGNKYFYQAEDPDKFRQIITERQFIVGRLLEAMRNNKKHEEWKVRTTNHDEVRILLKRAKKKEFTVIRSGTDETGAAVIAGKRVLLWSENKEVSALEIISSAIAELHKKILKTT